MNELIQLTQEHLDMFRTSRNGLTGLTMEILSGTRNPVKGWFKRCLGKTISIEDFHRIMQDVERIEAKHSRKNLPKAPDKAQLNLFS